ncbi:hypothetical protein DXT99_22170 [Pontibacter diazotrophicus]|uniref:Insertion element IS150 protein InsJ-like helix-turn-helix domain-containing protein n=1 Tax=Pontibacter diazotrophicus TaxID=1400979 RepID=A0A3D8L6D7_9BACT|nr:leucine zipper domain-containing protein [Pontibacter diazotrophicus]RDV12975.1 hypothetical protein DXT99_22170 [Pontibacter diazotrophicus]
MKKEEQKQKAREDWIKVYQQLGSVSKAALRCGIARFTLHRWIKRLPDEGLADRSRRPYRLARQKWDDDVVSLIQDKTVEQRVGVYWC